jgi:iron complex outermembrane receptor protein
LSSSRPPTRRPGDACAGPRCLTDPLTDLLTVRLAHRLAVLGAVGSLACAAGPGLAQVTAPAGPGPAPAGSAPAAGVPASGASPASDAPATAPRAATAEPAQRIVVEGAAPVGRDETSVLATVIGRDELDQYGDTSLLDLLQRVPGLVLDGETPRLRGAGSGQTLILLNGEPAPPGFSLDSLSPADIERIEIVKGPSAEFGSAGGTINVILRNPRRAAPPELRAALGWRAVVPQGNASFAAGARLGPVGLFVPLSGFTWALSGRTEQLRLGREPVAGVPTVRRQRQAGSDLARGGGINFGPRLDWRLTPTQTLQAQLFAQRTESDNRFERATEVLEGPPPTSLRDEGRSRGRWQLWRTQLSWVLREPSGVRLELRAGAQGTQSRSTGSTLGSGAGGLTVSNRLNLGSDRERVFTQAGRARLPLPAGAGRAHTLVLGWDLEDRQRRELRRLFDGTLDGAETVAGTLGRPFEAGRRRALLFAQDEWEPAPGWTWVGGLRAERWAGQALGSVAATAPATALEPVRQQGDALLPTLGLRRTFAAAPAMPGARGRAGGVAGGGPTAAAPAVLRLNLARSLRLPDLPLLMPRYSLNGGYDRSVTNTPLAADSAGNPLLRPERALALDIAWESPLPGGATLVASAFHRRIDDLIRRRIGLETVAEAPVPRWVSRPVNLGHARSTGVELEWRAQAAQVLPAGWAPAAPLALRASLAAFRSDVEQIDDPDARLEGQAPWGAGLGFDHGRPGGRFTWGASLNLTPAFSTQQSDRQRLWRSGVQRLDAYALWRVSRQVQLRLAGQNLLAPSQRTRSSIEDLDGFGAGSQGWRSGLRQVTASLVVRL